MIDTHAHLTGDALGGQSVAIATRARLAGVEAICNICTEPRELELGRKLQQECPWVYSIASTTPHDAATQGEAHFLFFETAAKNGELVAIGETGLDYFHHKTTAEEQKKLFIRYLALAEASQLPVSIHCRDAFEDLVAIVQAHYRGSGVIHCFTGNLAEAKACIDLGFSLAFGGMITFKKNESLRLVAAQVPLERLLVETDAPYLAPQSHRGQVNEPAFLEETVAFLASLHSMSVRQMAACTTQNAKALFKLPSS